MKYTREQIEDCARDLKEESANAENALFGSNDKAALMLRQLLAEVDALREDAERYRWLRDEHIGDDPESINLDRAPGQRGLDAAIDAARKKG